MDKGKSGKSPKDVWDPFAVELFLDVCIEEVLNRNRHEGYLNPTGYKNLIKNFNERTKRNYERKQVKNRWETLKKEYNTWKTLNQNASGLGRDPITKTIAASDEWWELEIKRCPDATKFRNAPLAIEDKMSQIFYKHCVTNEHARVPLPTALAGPSQVPPSLNIGDDELSGTEMDTQVTPGASGRGKKRGCPYSHQLLAADPAPDSPSSPSKSRPKSSHKRQLLPAAKPKEGNPLEALLEVLPGRRAQATDLLRLLAPSPALPVLLHGAAATGKTCALLLVLRHLCASPRLVYAALRSLPSPRALFASILSQLKALSSSNSSPQRIPDKPSDFIPALRDALAGIVAQAEPVYLVFDNLEVVRGWDKGGQLLSLLLRLHDLLRLPQVVLVYVSSATPDAYYTMTGSVEPNHIYFPDYTVDEAHDILMRGHPNPKLYLSFLSVVLKPLFRVTRRVDELAAVLKPLFRRYCDPLGDLNGVPDEGIKRRLFEHLQPHLAVALNETFSVPVRASVGDCKDGISRGKVSVKRQFGGRDGLSSELEFHMSVSAKYLLLSAFLASTNPTTLDAALFDSTGGSNNRNRKRKSSQASIDRKDTLAEEMLMKGPGTFPLERLLAIFQCITSVSEDVLDEVECSDTTMGGSGMNALMSDVLLQLSTLCNSNFLSKSRSCPLEGSARYRSNIDEDLALKVARSVSFPLSKYMYRR